MQIEIDADKYSISATTHEPAIIPDGLFGGIATTQLKNTWQQFVDSSDHIGLSHIRWPGGTVSEAGYFDPQQVRPIIKFFDGQPPEGWLKAYSFAYPDLIHPKLIESGAYVGFHTALTYAVEHGMSLSISLPVEQMYTDDMLSQISTVTTFLSSLFLNHGDSICQLVEPLIINVGNEQYGAPDSYAEAVMSVAMAVNDYRATHPEDIFKIAVQSMNDISVSNEFILKLESYDSNSMLSNIDIVRHHFLNMGLQSGANIETAIDRTLTVNTLVDLIESVGGRSTPVTLYASAFSSGSMDVSDSFDQDGWHSQRGMPMTLASAASLVSLFSGFVELGYQHAALWGLGAVSSQQTVASYLDGDMKFSPAAEAYRMMSENIRGMVLLDDASLDNGRLDADIFHYSFVDSSKVVIFLAADDLPKDSLKVSLNIKDFGQVGNVWLERIVCENGSFGAAKTVLESASVNGGIIDVDLKRDFDFVMVTILKDRPGEAYVHSWGSDISEILRAGDGGSLIEANAGNDSIFGGAGADVILGGVGNDIIFGGHGMDVLTGGEGRDLFVFHANDETDTILDFEVGVDIIDLSDWFEFNKSDNLKIEYFENGAVLQLGSDRLVILTKDGQSIPAGKLLSSDLTSLWGSDIEKVVIGNIINVSSSLKKVNGGSGGDNFVISSGAHNINGGDGFDFVDYRNTNTSQLVDLQFPKLNRGPSFGNTYISIEGVIGGSGADNIRGNDADNRLNGQGNSDWLFGRRGNDVLDGGEGNDVLVGGEGRDTLIGGSGIDRAEYSQSPFGVTVDFQFTSQNTGEAKGDIFIGIEDLMGSSFSDFMYGNADSNGIFGGKGNDFLEGRAGDDYLNGGAGRDTLSGGDGNDVLRGGTHADTFIFSGGRDTIEDLRVSDFDKLGIDVRLLSPNQSVESLIKNCATILDGKIVLDFEHGNSIVLEGLGSLSDLSHMIYFF